MTESQIAELQRLKQYFPFDIVFGAISPDGEFSMYHKPTMHKANALARKGWQVWMISN